MFVFFGLFGLFCLVLFPFSFGGGVSGVLTVERYFLVVLFGLFF